MGDRVIRDFGTVIALVARGSLLERLDEKVADLLEELENTGDDKASGSLTLTLSFQRIGEKTDVKGEVKIKPPAEKALPATTLFNVEGGLSVQHPSQLDMLRGPHVAASRDMA